MGGLCAKPGCSAEAVGGFLIDLTRRSVTIELDLRPDATHLCQKHLDSFKVPMKWELIDATNLDEYGTAPLPFHRVAA